MSRMDENFLKLARQCAPLLVAVFLGACAAQQNLISADAKNADNDASAGRVGAAAGHETATGTPGEPPRIVRQPVDGDVIYHVLAAEYLGGEDDLVGAARAYAEAAKKSIDPGIAERASRIAYAAEEWEALDEATARWLELTPEAGDAHKLRAISNIEAGNVPGAVSNLEWVLQHENSVEEAWATAAALIASAGNQTYAGGVLDALLLNHQDDTSADSRYGRSILAYRLQRYEQAQELANQAAAHSDNIEIIRWAAQVAHAQGDTAGAMAHYRHALEVHPRDRDLNLAYAELLRLNDRMDEALDLLEKLPPDSATLYTLAVYANSAQRHEETERYYRQLRKLDDKGGAEHFYFCGQVAEAIKRFDEAVYCYRQVQGGRDAKNAAIRLGYALSQAEGVATATEHLQRLQMLDDAELVEQAFIAESQILRDAGDNEQALLRLSDGLAVLHDNMGLLYARALVAEAMGDIALAEQDLRTIIQNDPQNAAALNALGYTLANRTTRYQEALSLIERALSLNPADAATLDSMGWVLYRMGRPEEAQEYLHQALAADPNPEIAAHLGEVLWQLGQQEDAMQAWRTGHALNPEDAALVETLQRFDIQL